MNSFDSSQVPHCAVCGRELLTYPLIWSSKYGGYICYDCSDRDEIVALVNENQRMKEALMKIRELAEFSYRPYGSDTAENYGLILKYAQEGLGKLEENTE